MCNAHNHPPGCNCGWGGVWYGATRDSDSWLFNRPIHYPRKFGRQSGTFQQISTGYTNPNSKCPVCGAPVFFYQSPFGGRVFFDELGPPWPKHPCTDHGEVRRAPRIKAEISSHPLKWLSAVQLDRVNASTLRMSGVSGAKKYIFFFDADESVMAEIVRFRHVGAGTVEISILDYNDEARSWISWSGLCRTQEISQEKHCLTKEVIHKHSFPPEVQRASSPKEPSDDFGQQGKAVGYKFVLQEVLADGCNFYQCPRCHALLSHKRARTHLRKVHGLKEDQLPVLPHELYTCPKCGILLSKYRFSKHLIRQHGVQSEDLLTVVASAVANKYGLLKRRWRR